MQCVVCLIISKGSVIIFRYHSNPASSADESAEDDPYRALMQEALENIAFGWEEATDEDDNQFPDTSLCRLFIFLPDQSMHYVRNKQEEGLHWLVGRVEGLVGLKAKVSRYKSEPGFFNAAVEVSHDAVHLPIVLLNGNQVAPLVPGF